MRFLVLIFAALVMVVAIAGLSGGERSVQAAPVTFELQARGEEEVPPCTSAGTAFGRFTFDDVTRELTFAITISGISSNQVIGSHFHRGARGTNGPIIYRFADEPFTQVAGRLTIAEADVEMLKTGGFYWNNHSLQCPGGFARAQVFIPSAPATPAPAATAAPAVRAPSTGDAGLLRNGDSSEVWLASAVLLVLTIGGITLAYTRR